MGWEHRRTPVIENRANCGRKYVLLDVDGGRRGIDHHAGRHHQSDVLDSGWAAEE
jgi:hypothetical protein